MTSVPERSDPIREEYYAGLERAERMSNWLFFFGAATSLLILVVDRNAQPNLYNSAQSCFVIAVALGFVASLAIRLYFQPRAEDARRDEIISNAFGIPLTHKKTIGYYNNSETEPMARLGMSILESAFFGKSIVHRMLIQERIKASIYVVLWSILALSRSIELEWVAIAAQAVLSEQILSRWIRLEWGGVPRIVES